MRRALRLALVCAGLAAAGCRTAKPYANDPLLRGGRAVWLAREVTQPPAGAEPAARAGGPAPPAPPTSRPE